jgi:endonuclease YncB( thermonuclease family)
LGPEKLISRSHTLRFPRDRKSRLRNFTGKLRWFAVFLAIAASAWYLEDLTNNTEAVTANDGTLVIADGDSFAIGSRKLRLDGIDAPEYRQSCNDPRGALWECGKAARAALEQMLRAPGLVCRADVRDRYSRSIASCSTTGVADIAAAHVANGWAVSNEHYGLREYGDEEDAARNARRGIWAGKFVQPSDWRRLNPRP